MTREQAREFYVRNLAAWFKFLFDNNVTDFRHTVCPRNCQTGLWHEISWTQNDQSVYVSASRMRLAFERAIDKSLELETDIIPRVPLELVKTDGLFETSQETEKKERPRPKLV